jgi:DNA-binding transcriptional MocR family regulator
VSLHQPATLQKQQSAHTASNSINPQQQQHLSSTEQQQQQHEPVGMDVVITPGASAALDSLVRVLVNPGDPVLVEEFTYAHMAEAHLLPLG